VIRRLAVIPTLAAILAGPVFAQGVSLPDATRVVLDNGAVIVVNEKDDVPLVGIEVLVSLPTSEPRVL